jgi:hypothetical protein
MSEVVTSKPEIDDVRFALISQVFVEDARHRPWSRLVSGGEKDQVRALFQMVFKMSSLVPFTPTQIILATSYCSDAPSPMPASNSIDPPRFQRLLS